MLKIFVVFSTSPSFLCACFSYLLFLWKHVCTASHSYPWVYFFSELGLSKLLWLHLVFPGICIKFSKPAWSIIFGNFYSVQKEILFYSSAMEGEGRRIVLVSLLFPAGTWECREEILCRGRLGSTLNVVIVWSLGWFALLLRSFGRNK